MSHGALKNIRSLLAWGRRDRGFLCRGGIGSHPIRRVGIIGAGMMGTSIAAAHVRHGLSVVIYDEDADALGKAEARIGWELAETAVAATASDLIFPAASLSDAAHCDLVLESIVEHLPAKQKLHAALAKEVGRDAIVATNTSTIPIERLTPHAGDPSQFLGMHFCHPVRERPLVEIVRGPKTSELAVARAVAHVLNIDRVPIIVPDSPGFVVNRLLFPYLGEALELLREGAAMESVEQAARDFGMAVGPLRLMDEIGLDTALHAAWVLASAYPDRIVSSPLLVAMVKAGRLGKKSGAGFFSYAGATRNDAAGVDDGQVSELIAPWVEPKPLSPETTAHRLVLPMLLEATRILDERKVEDARDIDLAVLFGLGFPADKGGLLWWGDTLGASRVMTQLQALHALGPRAEPTPLLKTLARTNGKFYG